MHTRIVKFALNGPITLLIGGNRYDHYGINYAIAAATSQYEYILDKHIFLSRAETCYQMVELLAQTQTAQGPILILDLLKTFYDESIHDREIHQLLFEAILALRRFSQKVPVVVSAHPGRKRSWMLKVLKNAVHQVERLAPRPSQSTCQRRFFQ